MSTGSEKTDFAGQPRLIIGTQQTGLDKHSPACSMAIMSKALSLVILAMMAVQVIKPLGLPGLKKRSDFWKLAVLALGAISLAVLLSHGR